MLHALSVGRLRTEANDATIKSGFGRIKHENGTYEDITPLGVGRVRTLLDHVEPKPEDEVDWGLDLLD